MYSTHWHDGKRQTNSSPLKIDPWNLGDSYWEPPFLGAMLVLGSVSFVYLSWPNYCWLVGINIDLALGVLVSHLKLVKFSPLSQHGRNQTTHDVVGACGRTQRSAACHPYETFKLLAIIEVDKGWRWRMQLFFGWRKTCQTWMLLCWWVCLSGIEWLDSTSFVDRSGSFIFDWYVSLRSLNIQNRSIYPWVVVSNIFLCSSLPGEMIQFD